MKTGILSILIFFATLGTLSSAQAAWWAPILSCDNGAAVIDIDLGERRNTQLVIRNSQIISYFNQAGAELTGVSWLVWDGRLHNLTNTAEETVIPGQMDSGIFQADQFRGFTSPLSYNGRLFFIRRDGNSLSLEVVAPGHSAYCPDDWDSGNRCDNPVPGEPSRKIANWYFQNCQELNTP